MIFLRFKKHRYKMLHFLLLSAWLECRFINVYAMMCSFFKKRNLKIKKGGARLVRLFQILKISCSWLSGKANTKQKSNTNDIRSAKRKRKPRPKNWAEKKDLISFSRHFLLSAQTSDAFTFSFPFLARYYVPYFNTFFLYCCCFFF